MAEEKKAKKTESKKDKDALSDVFDDSKIVDDNDRSFRRRRRVNIDLKCPLCETGVKNLSYKNVYQLKKYTSVRGKIIGAEKSGMCSKHQRALSTAIKKARYMALLPYVSLTEPGDKA